MSTDLRGLYRSTIPQAFRQPVHRARRAFRLRTRAILHKIWWRDYFILSGLKVADGPHLSAFMRKRMLQGEYESAEVELLERVLQPDDQVLELGAGIGLLSALCARNLGPGRVTCVEANPALVPIIEKTHRLNDVSARIVAGAVARENGRVHFLQHRDFWSSRILPADAPFPAGETDGCRHLWISSHAFIDLIREQGTTLLLCDIEGAETDILGDVALPDSVRRILVEVHPHHTGQEALDCMSANLGHQGFALVESLGSVWHFARTP